VKGWAAVAGLEMFIGIPSPIGIISSYKGIEGRYKKCFIIVLLLMSHRGSLGHQRTFIVGHVCHPQSLEI